MNKFLFFITFIFSFCSLKSQQNYYAYLQTQNQTPFYIRYNAKLISSSLNGFLILPKLANGDHIIKIGFPKSSIEETLFPISINGKDEGYTLQIIDGLISSMQQMQSNIAILPLNKGEAIAKTTSITKPQGPNVIVETPKTPSIDTITTANTNITKVTTPNVIPVSVNQTEKNEEIKSNNKTIEKVDTKNSTLVVRSSIITQENTLEAIYIINEDGKSDTIVVQMPFEAPFNNKEIETPIKETEKEVVVNQKDTIINTNKDLIFVESNNETNPPQNIELLENSDCNNKQKVSEEKCKAIRVKMAKKSTIAEMDKIVISAFNKNCFTAAQIKYLGVLYDEDNDKLAFFKLAYPFINDTNNFKKLHSEFKSNEAKENFKSLFKK